MKGQLIDDTTLADICHEVVDAVDASLAGFVAWRGAGGRPGQYALDLLADGAALDVLSGTGLGVLSEESGRHRSDAQLIAVVDPVDGSTNASRRIPWYATSICIVDHVGARVAVVANLATKERYEAIRGRGASKDGERISPSACNELRKAVVGLSGFPKSHLGWAQFRAFGAAALELCAVAEGTLDAFTVGGGAHLAPWDYLGGMLVCSEAGASVCELDGRELVVALPEARRAPAAAATPELLEQLRTSVAGAATPAVPLAAGSTGSPQT
jgi:myo-inositol-1(or 4)-monophosphatase